MSQQWAIVDAVTGNFVGWQRSSSATEIPVNTAEHLFYSCSDAQLTKIRTAQAELQEEGRTDSVLWNGGDIKKPEDLRPVFSFTVDKTLASVGETITATITRLNDAGLADEAFTSQIPFRALGGRVFMLNFVAGIAQKSIIAKESGDYKILSTPEFRLLSPASFTVVE